MYFLVTGYALVIALLFCASALPLEAKAFTTALLSSEIIRYFRRIHRLQGNFQLHIDGRCFVYEQEWQVVRIRFFSRWLVIIDLNTSQQTSSLPLFIDAFPSPTFRHLSRIILAMKVNKPL